MNAVHAMRSNCRITVTDGENEGSFMINVSANPEYKEPLSLIRSLMLDIESKIRKEINEATKDTETRIPESDVGVDVATQS